jgi:hypothetical protein
MGSPDEVSSFHVYKNMIVLGLDARAEVLARHEKSI